MRRGGEEKFKEESWGRGREEIIGKRKEKLEEERGGWIIASDYPNYGTRRGVKLLAEAFRAHVLTPKIFPVKFSPLIISKKRAATPRAARL